MYKWGSTASIPRPQSSPAHTHVSLTVVSCCSWERLLTVTTGVLPHCQLCCISGLGQSRSRQDAENGDCCDPRETHVDSDCKCSELVLRVGSCAGADEFTA